MRLMGYKLYIYESEMEAGIVCENSEVEIV